MFGVNEQLSRATPSDLQRVIEPLASYICATDRPKAVLNLAFSVLFNEVAQMTRVAKVHVARTTSKKAPRPVEFALAGSTRR
jgi:hypothetical protein